jgi:subtilase family serine protease
MTFETDASTATRRARLGAVAAALAGGTALVAGTGLAAAAGLVAVTALVAGTVTPASATRAAGQLSAVRIFPAIRVLDSAAYPPANGLQPQQITTAYNLGPLRRRNIDGSGQTIVLVDSFGSPTIASDLKAFDAHYHLPAPPSFRVIQPAGKVPPYRATSTRIAWATEATLDVEWSHVMAPRANIVLIETPTAENEGTSGFPQIVRAEEYAVRHRLGQVISQSFAATEQTFPSRAAVMRLRGAFKLAAADHVTVLAASGDNGSTGDTTNMKSLYTTRAISWPASDPLVTAVGGSQLDLRANGTRRSPDVAWSDSGGGRSIFFARPSYQYRVRQITRNRRGVPDISMDASCNSGVVIYATFRGSTGLWSAICGTSVATPLFAGVVALADQVAGHSLGLLNPALYAMAAAHARGIVDIVKGNNTTTVVQGSKKITVIGFSARRGYDLISGVGTINAAYFVPELAARAGIAHRR